VAFVQQDKDF